MSVNKPEKQAQEHAVFMLRNEEGIQAMRAWLWARRQESQWVALRGEDLVREQGAVHLANDLLRMIDEGPKIKLTGVAS